MLRRIRRAVVALALMGPWVPACATSDEATKPITYSLTARQNYEKGVAELKDESYPEALKYFTFVKQKFPFSKYAVLSELAMADTQFAQENHAEAIDSYKSFARLHPTHERVDDGYVALKVAESYVRQMPEDWFLVPPAFEKDQSAVRDALRELDDFLAKFPDSKFVKEAKVFRQEVLRRLVDHEVYVARFYLERDHPKAAVLRLEAAIRRYPGSGREPDLLLALGQTHLRMGDTGRATSTFRRVIDEYGSAYQARRAQLYLDFMKRRTGGAPQAKAEAS